MITKKEIVEQSDLAFDFIQKLYLETSYLIKEIESLVKDEDEEFIIGKPGGYGINAKGSRGLESNYVKLWLLRKFAVFFVPKNMAEKKGGQLITPISKELKIIYLRITLNSEILEEPEVLMGVLGCIETRNNWKKFEHIMGYLEYYDDKAFKDIDIINYNDKTISLKGKLHKENLFDLNDSKTIKSKLVDPALKLYRNFNPLTV